MKCFLLKKEKGTFNDLKNTPIGKKVMLIETRKTKNMEMFFLEHLCR